MSQKKPEGRPPMKLSDLPKDWDKRILALASEGASIVELAVDLDIGRTTFYELSKREPEFANTVKKCKRLCEAWWERQGRTNMHNKDFSYVGWYMNMKNRFGWRDKQEMQHSGTVPVVIDVLGTNTDKPDSEAEEDD